MPKSEHSEPVKASLSIIWDQLVHKIYDPRNFVPGVTDVQILEDDKEHHRVIRRMVISNPKGDNVIVEEITWDEATHLVVFKLIEHPSHTGSVINRVDIKGENDYVLTYRMEWTFKGEGEDPLAAMSVKPAVIKTVQVIEAEAAVLS